MVAFNFPIGQWHTVSALESGSVILEMKDGAYEPLGDEDIEAIKVFVVLLIHFYSSMGQKLHTGG